MNPRPRTLGTCILDFKLLVGWALRGSNVEKGTTMPCRGTRHQEISKGGSGDPLFSRATTRPSFSLHSGKNLTVPLQGEGSGPLSTFSSQNLILPTSVPSSSSIALQMWNGVLGCHAGCDKENTQSPFLGASTGVPVAAAAAMGLVSSFPIHLAISLH